MLSESSVEKTRLDTKGIHDLITNKVGERAGGTLNRLIEDCGFKRPTFFTYLRGDRDWTINYLVRLSDYFGLTLDEMVLRGGRRAVEKIRNQILRAGVKQTHIARHLGITSAYLCMILSGKRKPPKPLLDKLAKLMRRYPA